MELIKNENNPNGMLNAITSMILLKDYPYCLMQVQLHWDLLEGMDTPKKNSGTKLNNQSNSNSSSEQIKNNSANSNNQKK